MNTALLIVDIQKDYFSGGRMELVGADTASEQARRILAFFRERKLPVFHVQHVSTRADAAFFLPDTEGVSIHDSVAPLSDEIVIRKHFPNSFRDTGLQEILQGKGIQTLVICGMMSHMCIDATVRAAFDHGYTCIVVHDACATRALSFSGVDIPAQHVHGAYMAALSAVYAKVLSADEVINLL